MPAVNPAPALNAAGGTDPTERCEALDAEILRIAGLSNAIEYQFIKLLAEFDELDGWVGDGVKSFAHWLNWRCGMHSLVAREKIRVARCLRDLPKIDEAFARGEVCYTKVRAMTRVANPKNEEYLLAIARHGTARHVEQAVRKFNWSLRRNAIEGEDELKAYKTTPRLNYYEDEHGMVTIKATLPAESGVLVAKAIEKMADQMRKTDAANEDLVEETVTDEDVEKSGAANEKSGENVSRETFECGCEARDFDENRAMALANIAEHFLSTSEDGANTLAPTDKYQVIVHVNANEAHRDYKISGDEPCCYLEEGRFLAPHVARQLACAAAVTTAVEDDDGNILNIGRKSRTPNRAITMAVQQRDGGCRYPNCHQQKWTDQHHIIHWADGGETSAENLITLCRHHHRALHKGEYSIVREGNQLMFISKSGHTITRALYPQFPDAPLPLEAIRQYEAECRKRGITIDKHTANCRWDGEAMDYAMFIDAMYQFREKDADKGPD